MDSIGQTERSIQLQTVIRDGQTYWAWVFDDSTDFGQILDDKLFNDSWTAKVWMEERSKGSFVIRSKYV